jgi:multidrug efflux pump subunit AcrB
MQTPALFRSHRVADLVLVLVLLLGAWSYWAMPRAQYPEVQLNWVAVAVVWPGAAAQEVEREVAMPLEAAMQRVPDINLVSSTSRDHVATLLVRFRDMPHERFEKHLEALEREIRQAAASFPKEAQLPQVIELTSSNFFPTAMVAISGRTDDVRICDAAEQLRTELQALPGVGRVWPYGLMSRELAVNFDPKALLREQVSAETLTRTVMEQARTLPAGVANISERRYAIRVEGLNANPDYLAELPIPRGARAASSSGSDTRSAAGPGTAADSVPLGELADIKQGTSPSRELVRLNGKPAVLLTVTKTEGVNALTLTDRIHDFIDAENAKSSSHVLTLVDDQSLATREAIGIMETNAIFGMIVVLAVTWFFLGKRMALLTSLGVPFALAGMFAVLYFSGQTLNVSVLLGVAIVLGIPLDDAVVVADAIRMRLAAGLDRVSAVREALQEVARPVSASVFATCLAFAPLLFLPGLMGRFMFVTPLTVVATLLMSLVASLWLLPRHAVAWGRAPASHGWRTRLASRLRRHYGHGLTYVFRHPQQIGALFGLLFLVSGLAIGLEWIKPRWFASDPLRVFNLNVQTPPSSTLKTTLAATETVEKVARSAAQPGELNATLSMAGLQFTPRELALGDHLGQVTVSLAPASHGARSVDEFVNAVRLALKNAGQTDVEVQVLSADLPMLSNLSLRLTGAPQAELALAAEALSTALAQKTGFTDIRNDSRFNQPRLTLRVNAPAAIRAGMDPFKLAALIHLHFEGITVGKVLDGDDALKLVVRGQPMSDADWQQWMTQDWQLPGGGSIKPSEIFTLNMESAPGELRRVNSERTVTVLAGFDQDQLTAGHALRVAEQTWQAIQTDFPGVEMAQGGELDDVKASLNDLLLFLLLGFGLMYTLLALQFGRLVLPLIILATALMALGGVVIGLWVTGQPITLYTLYGCVALSGIAVNASIVLVSAGEDRFALGMPPLKAAFFAARRRLLPIVITTTTVIGGLISLAFGWGGDSLLWGPVAAAIVWGLLVATPLTLFATPLMHAWLMRQRKAT